MYSSRPFLAALRGGLPMLFTVLLVYCLVALPSTAQAADASILKVTVFASLGKALPLEVVAGLFHGYTVKRQGDALHLTPMGYTGSDSLVCTVQQRDKNGNANAFTDGLMDIFTSAKDNALMAQAWYTDTKVTFTLTKSLAHFTNLNHIILIRRLCRKMQGFTYDYVDSVVATEFVNAAGEVAVYNGGLLDLSLSPPVSATRKAGPRFHIAETVYQSWPQHSAAFDEVYRTQRQLAAKTAAIPLIERARAALYESSFDTVVDLLEPLSPAMRGPEEAALLGMSYYAQSYSNINDSAGRQKAVDTIMAVQGEGNAAWHYALSYVLHVWDPAAAVPHAQKALELDEAAYDFLTRMIPNRRAQVMRDARIRDEVLKNNAAHRPKPFTGFDKAAFWENSDYARKEYIAPVHSEADMATRVKDVRQRTGYTLPEAYVELMHQQNGGIPRHTFHKTDTPTMWSEQGVEISGLYSVGGDQTYGLLGWLGSRTQIENMDYPDIGIYFANTPTAGHDMLALDYRFCGPEGEPAVVHVGKEDHFSITFVAKDFETFVKGLEKAEEKAEED